MPRAVLNDASGYAENETKENERNQPLTHTDGYCGSERAEEEELLVLKDESWHREARLSSG